MGNLGLSLFFKLRIRDDASIFALNDPWLNWKGLITSSESNRRFFLEKCAFKTARCNSGLRGLYLTRDSYNNVLRQAKLKKAYIRTR